MAVPAGIYLMAERWPLSVWRRRAAGIWAMRLSFTKCSTLCLLRGMAIWAMNMKTRWPALFTIPFLMRLIFTADTINERKWQHCIGLPGVGFYPDAGICENNYRPTDDCIMHRVFGFPAFCPVCRENSTAWLDSLINPIYNVSPNTTDFTSGNYNYSVQVQEPTVNTYRYQWWLDNALVAQNALSHSVDFSVIDKSQNHTLRFVCTDVDPFIIDTNLRRPLGDRVGVTYL
jgi:hypothetical protein